MKKAIALFLTLAICLPLVACGNNDAVAGTWISIWDESEKLVLNKDGSGDIFGYECKWKLEESSVVISYKSVLGMLGGMVAGGKPEYNLVNQNGIEVLKKGDNTENLVISDDLIREEGYAENVTAIREQLASQAIEVDWTDFVHELYDGNAARAKAKYAGQAIVITLIVYDISENMIEGSDLVTNLKPAYRATVYLAEADLMQIDIGDEITVCGYFGEETFNTDNNIYSPIEPAFLVNIK